MHTIANNCVACGGVIPRKLTKGGQLSRGGRRKYCGDSCKYRVEYQRKRTFALNYQKVDARRKYAESRKLVRGQYAEHLSCLVCGKQYARRFCLNGKPRKHESPVCGDRCESWLFRFTHGLGAPTRQRPCKRCGEVFVPKQHDITVYCSQTCKKRDWADRHPEARARYEANARARAVEGRQQYLLSADYQRQRLIKLLRRVLIIQRRQETALAKRCLACGHPVGAGKSKYCSRRCRWRFNKTARRDATRRYRRIIRQRDRDLLRPQYLKRRLQCTTGLKPSQVPLELLEAKREQLSVYRQIQELKNAISKTRRS